MHSDDGNTKHHHTLELSISGIWSKAKDYYSDTLIQQSCLISPNPN